MKSEDLRGTDPYLAPETLFYKYDKFYNSIHSDVFSIGVLLLSIFDRVYDRVNDQIIWEL